MSKAVGVVLSVAAVAVSIIAPFVAIPVWITAALVGAMALNALLMPKGGQQERQAAELALQIGERPRCAIVGEAATGGDLVDAFNYGGKHGTDWEVMVIRLADHRCAALAGFFVNDEYVAFAGDGAVAGYNGQLMVWWLPGTEHQAMPSVVTTQGGWAASDNLAGISAVVVAYKADAADAKNPVWPGGRPRFKWVVKGALCYDPRKDGSLPGGSGAHRRHLPATWEWSENPIVCRYAWVRGIYACDRVNDPDMLLVGRGLTAEEAPPENVFAAANLCDELVAGEPRYRVGGRIYANETYLAVEERFAAACAGIIIQPEGSVEIEPGQAKAPVAWITDADLLVGSQVEHSDFLSEADKEWVNTVVPRYVEPAQGWMEHAAPLRREIADVLSDGGPREETVLLQFVRWAAQAGRVGEIWRRLGRLWDRATITLGPRFAYLEEGDWIVWTSARRFGGEARTFRAEAYGLDARWHSRLRLRRITASVYSDGAFLPDEASPATPTPRPGLSAPGAGAWTLSAETLTLGANYPSLPALVIAGAADDRYAAAIRFEYWRDDGVTDPAAVTDWIGTELAAPDVKRREIVAVASGGTYYAAVSYLIDGEPTPRRILGPVTVGALLTAGHYQNLIRGSYPAGLTVTGRNVGGVGEIVIGDHFRDYPDRGDRLYLFGGLISPVAPGTYYLFYDDPTLADQTPDYQATTVFGDSINSNAHPFRHDMKRTVFVPPPGGSDQTAPPGGGGYGGGDGTSQP
ncbi:MAG: phage tail protein [Allosphingosinicella sp.]|uniref:phage tail protein n=1 Tax=Allosphingosinicella sp. TaxID=2823234 RepID=UPI003934E305